MNGITGHIFQVTNLNGFFSSIGIRLFGPSKDWLPDPATFQPLANAKVELRPTGILPAPLFDDIAVDTGIDGSFQLPLPTPLPPIVASKRFQLLVSRRERRFARPSASLETVFRSVSFDLTPLPADPIAIYVFPIEIGEDAHITQAFINGELGEVREEMKLTELEATIEPGKIRVEGRKRRNDISFNVVLFPSTSPQLDIFLGHRVENLNVDLSFFVGLCVNEEKLEQKIRVSIKELLEDTNESIKDLVVTAIGEATDQPGLAESIFDQRLSLIFAELQVQGPAGNRSIVPEPWMGLPRNPLT
jgi:hypothetical protein